MQLMWAKPLYWVVSSFLLLYLLGANVVFAQSMPEQTRGASAQVVIWAFHDVHDQSAAENGKDPYGMTAQNLATLFDWLQRHQWTPVSLRHIRDAQAGKITLPENAVLLSFDDGLKSTYSQVFPLLKAYNYPALVAVQTGWIEQVNAGQSAEYSHEDYPTKLATTVEYNGKKMDAQAFISWADIQNMHRSGLIEFATHTHDLHQGILANPQGNMQPAAITRQYDPKTGTYENTAAYQLRIKSDLQRSQAAFKKYANIDIDAIVWPYGAASPEAEHIAASIGLKSSFLLGNIKSNISAERNSYPRFLVSENPTPSELMLEIERAEQRRHEAQRVVQIDLDYMYDTNPEQFNRNLSSLLDRIKSLNIRTVYLQAFADPDADGTASALYFPNRHLPVRADIFNRVAWQLKTRAGVRVYAWLPLLSFDLKDPQQQQRLAVQVKTEQGLKPSWHDYRRLSPFLPEAMQIVGDIYADLGQNTSAIDGILIHDDAYLNEQEDQAACLPQARLPKDNSAITDCDALSPRDKTMTLIDFSHHVIQRLQYHQNLSNSFKTARNLYARPVLEPTAEARFSQALVPFMDHYDEVALMAMPYLDGTTIEPQTWLADLAQKVKAQSVQHMAQQSKVIFELQTYDWRKKKWIEGKVLRDWLKVLTQQNIAHLAYYPDDVYHNLPDLESIYQGISLNSFPYTPKGAKIK